MDLTNNETSNTRFSWEDLDGILNNTESRRQAAERLAQFAVDNRVEGEEITLIGHIHGGNVAIQAARMIFDETGEQVNLITIATPTYSNFRENPASWLNARAVNDHLHLWNSIDGVQGGFAGGETYEGINTTTINIEIDVSSEYYSWQWQAAHSFDVEHPELITEQVDIRLFPVEEE